MQTTQPPFQLSASVRTADSAARRATSSKQRPAVAARGSAKSAMPATRALRAKLAATLALTTPAIVVAALMLATPDTAQAQQSCPEWQQMIDLAAPAEVGSPTLAGAMLAATVPAGSQLSANLDVRRLRKALGSRLKADRGCPKPSADAGDGEEQGHDDYECTWRDAKRTKAVLHVDLGEGSVVFLDPSRSFDPTGPDADFSNEEATAIAADLVAHLGIPGAEVDLARPVIAWRGRADNASEGGQLGQRRIEANVDLYRTVGGFPVMGSRLRVAVGAHGLPSRIHADWPDFVLAGGLDDAAPLSRNDVLAKATEELGRHASCGEYSDIAATVAFVDARYFEWSDLSDEGDDRNGHGFVPALVIFATDDEAPYTDRLSSPTSIVATPLVAEGGQDRG
jgi:hypothetical protein